MKVADVSEDFLLSLFAPILPRSPLASVSTGDDGAVFAPAGDVVVSSDVLVQDVHFRNDWSTGYDVGYRAAMQNLADIVAMGAVPFSLSVGLTLPPETDVDWVRDLACGFASACSGLGVGVDGGDLSSGAVLSVAVTALGDMRGRKPKLRSALAPGDGLYHLGNLGHGRAGYELLSAGYLTSDENPKSSMMIAHFLRPEPPLVGMLDLHALSHRMGPIAVAAGRLGADRCEWALTGGEDHGFLFSAGLESVTELDSVSDIAQLRIGTVVGPDIGGKVTVSGAVTNPTDGGWDHFVPGNRS